MPIYIYTSGVADISLGGGLGVDRLPSDAKASVNKGHSRKAPDRAVSARLPYI